jgi:hypothetical protein
MGGSFIIGGFNDADEVIKAEHRVLTHDRATKGGNLLVDFLKAIRVLVQCLAPLGRQSTQ